MAGARTVEGRIKPEVKVGIWSGLGLLAIACGVIALLSPDANQHDGQPVPGSGGACPRSGEISREVNRPVSSLVRPWGDYLGNDLTNVGGMGPDGQEVFHDVNCNRYIFLAGDLKTGKESSVPIFFASVVHPDGTTSDLVALGKDAELSNEQEGKYFFGAIGLETDGAGAVKPYLLSRIALIRDTNGDWWVASPEGEFTQIKFGDDKRKENLNLFNAMLTFPEILAASFDVPGAEAAPPETPKPEVVVTVGPDGRMTFTLTPAPSATPDQAATEVAEIKTTQRAPAPDKIARREAIRDGIAIEGAVAAGAPWAEPRETPEPPPTDWVRAVKEVIIQKCQDMAAAGSPCVESLPPRDGGGWGIIGFMAGSWDTEPIAFVDRDGNPLGPEAIVSFQVLLVDTDGNLVSVRIPEFVRFPDGTVRQLNGNLVDNSVLELARNRQSDFGNYQAGTAIWIKVNHDLETENPRRYAYLKQNWPKYLDFELEYNRIWEPEKKRFIEAQNPGKMPMLLPENAGLLGYSINSP